MDVKLMFEMKHGGERMWVHVTDASERKLTGRLMNTPLVIPRLMADDLITFNRDHIIDIWDDDVSA